MIEVLGSRARIEILRCLHERGPLGTTELARELNAGHMTVYRHLQALEDDGLVAADAPADGRHGRVVLWNAVPGKFDELLERMRDYVTGGADVSDDSAV